MYYERHQLPPLQFHLGAPYFAPAKQPPDPPTITDTEDDQIRFQRKAEKMLPGCKRSVKDKKKRQMTKIYDHHRPLVNVSIQRSQKH